MLWNWYYRFLDWLEDEPEGKRLPLCLAKCTGLAFLYAALVGSILLALAWIFQQDVSLPRNIREEDLSGTGFPVVVLAVVLLEEIIFRLPLALAIRRWDISWQLWSAIAVSSVLFGIAHGSPWCILIQGVHGVLFALVFLKCGGLMRRWGKALLSAFTVHLCYDAVLFALIGIP